MEFVRSEYRKARFDGFSGFLDEIRITESAAGTVLRIRGWAKIEGSSIKHVNCYDTQLDAIAGRISTFFERDDLPEGALAFEAEVPVLEGGSTCDYEYGMLVEASDGKLYPIYHHSPKNVQIELDGRCNLRCVICPQAFGVHSGPLSSDDLNALRPILLQCECIEINHQGESLLSPKLAELLAMIPPHKHIAFNNNGTALKSKVVRRLLENAPPVRSISISIDASTESSFFKIRGTSLEKIMENAIAFKEARDAAGLHFPQIMLTCTVMNEFMDEVPGLVALAAKLDGVFRYWPLVGSGLHGGEKWVVPFHGTDSKFEYDKQIPRDGDAWDRMAKEVQREADRLGVNVVDPFQYSWSKDEKDGSLKPTSSEGISECQLIYRQHFFNANGNAQMCCVQTAPLFNWREFGPTNFDRHPAVVEARQDASRGVIPKACSGASCSYVAGKLAPSMSERPLTYIERGFI
ncbi:radical SAM protein [Burkholderia pyrrocinia]|uniref:radical SAM protein n=1 Tax=Burkholderia pyrrocinia TaxID=60550 RepID=UPI0038B46872